MSFPQFSQLFDERVVPANCEVTGILLQLLVGNKVDFKVITRNFKNTQRYDVIAQVQSSMGEVAPVKVKDNNNRSYSASFLTKHVGEVKLPITIEGQHIKGSPYVIMLQDYESIEKPMKSQ